MKKITITLALLFSATPSLATSASNQKYQNITCLNKIEETLATITHPSYLTLAINPLLGASAYYVATEVKETILENLSVYEDAIKQVRVNLKNNASNAGIYAAINKSLKAHESDTVLGIQVGKGIVDCVRPNLNFKGSKADQYALASAALSRIKSIRKSVQ